jgi:hypothetical protein
LVKFKLMQHLAAVCGFTVGGVGHSFTRSGSNLVLLARPGQFARDRFLRLPKHPAVIG